MNTILAAHDYKEAERVMRRYRANFHQDFFHDADGNEYCQGEERSRIGELEECAAWIQDYGFKIVIRNANTDNPKIRMRSLG